MTIYNISFEMNGESHFCSGKSSYPSRNLYESNTYSDDIVENNITEFIRLYKEQFGFNNQAHTHHISCTFGFE